MADFEPLTNHISRLELNMRIGPISFPFSLYLIKTAVGHLLVDTGWTRSADRMVAAVARATDGQGPRLVLLTHAHPDHAGGLLALREAWNPAIVCHRLEVPFVTGELYYRHLTPKNLAFWFGRFLIRPLDLELPVARDLEGGQSIEGMAVIHLPGHTPGQIGFLHPRDGAMICGDAIGNRGGRLRSPLPLATADPEAARRSMIRLGELDYNHLLPGHGPAILDHGRQAVLAYLQEAGIGLGRDG